jgi:hypothetical protein
MHEVWNAEFVKLKSWIRKRDLEKLNCWKLNQKVIISQTVFHFNKHVTFFCISLKGGYNFDFIMKNEDGEVAACMNYETRENPFDDTSPGVKVQLNRLTGKLVFIFICSSIKED